MDHIVQIPNSYLSVAESINVGVPIYDHDKSSRVTRSLVDLNTQLSGLQSEDKETGVMKRVFESIMGG